MLQQLMFRGRLGTSTQGYQLSHIVQDVKKHNYLKFLFVCEDFSNKCVCFVVLQLLNYFGWNYYIYFGVSQKQLKTEMNTKYSVTVTVSQVQWSFLIPKMPNACKELFTSKSKRTIKSDLASSQSSLKFYLLPSIQMDFLHHLCRSMVKKSVCQIDEIKAQSYK